VSEIAIDLDLWSDYYKI